MYSYYGYGNHYEKEFNFGLFFLYLLVVALIMFFEYVTGIIMIAFCEMMSDVHDLRDKFIIESEQKYNTRGVLISDEDRNRDIIAKGGWKCAGCGKVHPSYETSCVCGMLKSNN
ncbi:MAG: hypothetical protein Q4F06_06080 [Eubacteriales bacterium]|nr:hypothetical protein [Eubacteriales bacterium]